MNRIMLDLETLSSKPNAVIASIGAVWFDEERLGETFYSIIDTKNQPGRHVSAETAIWWMGQDKEAQKVFTDPSAASLSIALDRFRVWIGGNLSLTETARPGDYPVPRVEMWGNGADFDCVILGGAYEDCGIRRPWSYSKNRCFRTLKNIVKLRPGFGIPEREGTHHNALDDAIYQAKCAQVYLKELNGKQGNS